MAHVDTQQEGSGENNLIAWLKENKLQKVKDKLIENQVDLDEMTELNEAELREYAKNDLGLNVIEIKRFVKGVKKLQVEQPPQEVLSPRRQKVIVSTDEEDAMRKCDNTYDELGKEIENISSDILKLKEHQNKGTNDIESAFNNLFDTLNARKKQLINELNKISHEKTTKYTQKIDALKNTQKELKNCKAECEKLIFESDMDRTKRKIKILQYTDTAMNKTDYQSIVIPPNPVIRATFPKMDNIIKNVTALGYVDKGTQVLMAPIIEVSGVDEYCATVKISNVPEQTCSKPWKYKVEYAKITDKTVVIDDSNVEEMKLSWNPFPYSEDEEEDEDEDENEDNLDLDEAEVRANNWDAVTCYNEDGLDENTCYVVRCAAQNKDGWSKYSKVVTFTTLEDEDF